MIRAATFGWLLAALAAPAWVLAADEAKSGQAGGRVFEMRTYHTHPGRLDALNKRFREHTNRIFRKHGMEPVGYWTPQDEGQGKGNTLVYILAFPSREAARASWAAFRDDPEWKKVKDESEKDGPIVQRVDSVFLDPTDYSAIK